MTSEQYDDIMNLTKNYYNGTLDDYQKSQFEKNIITNHDFAEKAAFCKAIIIAKEQLQQEEIAERFKELYHGQKPSLKVIRFRKLYLYIVTSAAAAILFCIIGYFLFFRNTTTAHDLAQQYVDSNLVYISPLMGNNNDSLQVGILYYNRQRYDSALDYFQSSNSYQALEYKGLSYLLLKEYDNALNQFASLLKIKQQVNKAPFLTGITYSLRNQKGDNERAKYWFQYTEQRHGYGEKESREFLKKF